MLHSTPNKMTVPSAKVVPVIAANPFAAKMPTMAAMFGKNQREQDDRDTNFFQIAQFVTSSYACLQQKQAKHSLEKLLKQHVIRGSDGRALTATDKPDGNRGAEEEYARIAK